MPSENSAPIQYLINKGVSIPNPASVSIGSEVNLDRIAGDKVTIHAGSKIFGKDTLILSGARIGYEAPATIENCHIGPNVDLKGGYFKDAVFLKGASMGSGAHVREGTILEEMANGAHTVGLKQTILFPFVTLGSLINFCDCFMAGGTSRKDHSEVGSSYIHFNYTPNQDKATPSMLGDVPHGVMLNQRPIFLGGQGGLVGPCRIAYGTIIAAGSIYRKDETKPGHLLFDGGAKRGRLAFQPGLYRSIRRVMHNNLIYLANLVALQQWYFHVRRLFIGDDFPRELHQGLCQNLSRAIMERIAKLAALAGKMPASIATYRRLAGDDVSQTIIAQQQALFDRWDRIEALLNAPDTENPVLQRSREAFLKPLPQAIASHADRDYLTVITNMSPKQVDQGTAWLQGIVDGLVKDALGMVPELT